MRIAFFFAFVTLAAAQTKLPPPASVRAQDGVAPIAATQCGSKVASGPTPHDALSRCTYVGIITGK
jgi:hypothetical protein